MFYSNSGGTILSINCEVNTDLDISGIGFRFSLYLDALLSIVFAFYETSTKDALLSNFAHLGTAVLVIATAYFNPTIDAPHTIIVLHILAMLSASRYTSQDFPLARLETHSGTYLGFGMSVIDTLFRPLILAFNLYTWNAIRLLEQGNNFCPKGLGKWVFFGRAVEIKDESFGSRVAFILAISVIAFEGLRVIAELSRLCIIRDWRSPASSGLDPRLWLFHRICGYQYWNWPTFYKWLTGFSHIQRMMTCLYLSWTIEQMILENDLVREETNWTVEQVITVTGILCCLFLRWRIRLGSWPEIRSHHPFH